MTHPSIFSSFTTHLQQALDQAASFAREFGHKEVTSLHALYGLASEKGSLSAEMLEKANFPVDLLKQELIRRHHSPYLIEDTTPDFSNKLITILTKAVRTAQLYKHTYIGTEHVLACLLDLAEKELLELLRIWQISLPDLQRQALVVLKSTSKFPDLTQTLHHLQDHGDEDEPVHEEFPVLGSLGKELTNEEALSSTTPLIGREQELHRLEQILGRRFKNNPLLVGKAGVGKTALVEGLAQKILAGDSHRLLGKRLFSLELSSLVAGTMYRGEFEQRMKGLLDEVKEDPSLILFIDEIHTLMGAGSTGQALDAANIIKPALARGEIRCIGATTWDEYQKHIAPDAALSRRFQPIFLDEPSLEETRTILSGIKPSFEAFHSVTIPKETMETILDLSDRYLTHTCFPDKAVDVLDEAASFATMGKKKDPLEAKRLEVKAKLKQVQKKKNDALQADQYDKAIGFHKQTEKLLTSLQKLSAKTIKKKRLSPQHVQQVVSVRTGIPVEQLGPRMQPIATDLLKRLQTSIIGQDETLEKLALAAQRGFSPLKDTKKPFGAYLFLGPSGVGKTATAKALAKELFGHERALIRLDMSEYSDKFTMSKLVGAPAGYVGYQESGVLTNAVKRQPLSVILFDEIEKAHPDLFHLLLQILDEGTMTDGTGKTVDFRHCLIVMTSNLGLDGLQHQVGFKGNQADDLKTQIRSEMGSAMKSFLRTELINRLDEVFYFQPLGIEQRQAIIQQELERINRKLQDRYVIQASPEVLSHIATTAYVEEQGVRSLEKFLKEKLETELGLLLYKEEPGTHFLLEQDGDGIALRPQH